jgi:DNA processing protein
MKIIDRKRLILALAIHRIPGLQPGERLAVWDLVDDELSLSLLSTNDIEAAIGRSLGSKPWAPSSSIEAAQEDAEFLGRSGCRFIHYDDEAYPAALRETSQPPFGLFARGADLRLSAPVAAVVGTRMPTGRGLDTAFELARGLSSFGVVVVSGLARGIDAAAHRGALEGARAGGAPTCAVLPCGIDRIYPPGNRELASRILEEGGLLLAECPPGTEIRKYRFPARNRIIAGMARACVVVEAPAKSGALITAEQALDEGRDVWVAAECLGGARSAGIDRLESEGAEPLRGAERLALELRAVLNAREKTPVEADPSSKKGAASPRMSLERGEAR